MVKVTRATYKETKDFSKEQWKIADQEHYREAVDWKQRKIILKATENEKLVGVIKLKLEGGICDVESIIVRADKRGRGVGKALMKQAEVFAKRGGCHFLEFVTGVDWDARVFYKKLGYKVLLELPNYYHHRDFLWYGKYLN
jgi:ribosomal protein S18 acetylase RimI-like enzyme